MPKNDSRSDKEAMFYRRLEGNKVQCELCPRRCVIQDRKQGFCRVRENRLGTLYSLIYGKPCCVDLGLIEKAPIYHFLPGHTRLCLATVGCNLRCRYCQNWNISQASPKEAVGYNLWYGISKSEIPTTENCRKLSPKAIFLSAQDIVESAKKEGVRSISFTYTEPTVFYEYMYDISKLAKEDGLRTSIVSNGYINPEPLRKLLTVLDAVKVDLKSFSEKFYREVSSAELTPVLNTLKVLKEEGTYFEIVNLVIPTLNDDSQALRKMCQWIKENLGEDVPLHFTRFNPAYKMVHLGPTPVETLEEARRIAKNAGLKYVYIGNVLGHKYNSTFCPRCEKILIKRTHFQVLSNDVKNGKCPFCGYEIAGIWC